MSEVVNEAVCKQTAERSEHTVKKTLLLNPEKLRNVRMILGAPSDSEAIRILIEQALLTARRIQQRGTFGPDLDSSNYTPKKKRRFSLQGMIKNGQIKDEYLDEVKKIRERGLSNSAI
jgi:hypothetical protein